jgi:hypothetical protein
MLALLLHGAIFAPLPGGNYLQLAGTPAQAVRRLETETIVFTKQLYAVVV